MSALSDALKALAFVKADLDTHKAAKASLEGERETHLATITTLESKVQALTLELQFLSSSSPPAPAPVVNEEDEGW